MLLESLNKLYLPGSLGALRAWIQKGNPEAHAIMQALLRKGHLETLTGKKKVLGNTLLCISEMFTIS